MTPPSQRGERWTIYVCPDCARAEGQEGFDYEAAEQAWCCEACDNYPIEARKVEVIPLSAVQALAEELEERARRKNPEIGTEARAYAVAYRHAARLLRDLADPDKEDGPDE